MVSETRDPVFVRVPGRRNKTRGRDPQKTGRKDRGSKGGTSSRPDPDKNLCRTTLNGRKSVRKEGVKSVGSQDPRGLL